MMTNVLSIPTHIRTARSERYYLHLKHTYGYYRVLITSLLEIVSLLALLLFIIYRRYLILIELLYIFGLMVLFGTIRQLRGPYTRIPIYYNLPK